VPEGDMTHVSTGASCVMVCATPACRLSQIFTAWSYPPETKISEDTGLLSTQRT
jgi:hypothetical protein